MRAWKPTRCLRQHNPCLPTLLAAFSVFMLLGWRSSAVEAAATNAVKASPDLTDFPSHAEVKSAPDARRPLPSAGMGLRGVFFNPQVKQRESPEFPWLLLYPQCRSEVRAHLKELVITTDISFLSIFVNIAHSLKHPSWPPQEGQPLTP